MQRAVVHTDCPHVTEPITCDEHLDMAGVPALDDLERREVASRRLGRGVQHGSVGDAGEGCRTEPDVGDAEVRAHLGKRRLLRERAPADPRTIHARQGERRSDRGEVVDGDRPVDPHRKVGLAHEERPSIGLGVNGHDLDVALVLRCVLASGVDQSHGSRPAVDDRQSGDGRHRAHFLPRRLARVGGATGTMPAFSGASNASSGPPGSTVVV